MEKNEIRHIVIERNELIAKNKNSKRTRRVHKRKIKSDDLNREELIEIIRIYDYCIEIINYQKKKKFRTIKSCENDNAKNKSK